MSAFDTANIDMPAFADRTMTQTMHYDLTQSVMGLEGVFGLEYPSWKFIVDFVGALICLIAFSPLFLAVSVLIKMVSPGPVFFRQERIGQCGATFLMYKFRTMKVDTDTTQHADYMSHLINTDEDTPMIKKVNQSRLIPFGSFLRKSCIDELPQIFNVLLGDMSMIGPRPSIPYESKDYRRWHTRRFDAKPGMTGLWQVSGKNTTSFREMIRLDIQYVENCSLLLDLTILVKTPVVIVQQLAGKL